MNKEIFYSFHGDICKALAEHRFLDALNKLELQARYVSMPSIADDVQQLRQNYVKLLEYMKSGQIDEQRERLYLSFVRKSYAMLDAMDAFFLLNSSDGPVGKAWKKLHSNEEILAEEYFPYVEGKDGALATITDILADPISSYKQLFDTVLTSGKWSKALRNDVYGYIMNNEAPHLNRLTLVSAVGVSLLYTFDEEKFLLLLSVIEEEQVEVSVRALVMVVFASSFYRQRISLYPSILLKFQGFREQSCFHPLVVAVQKALLSAVVSPALSRDFEKVLPKQLEDAHENLKELPDDVSGEELADYIESHPHLRKFRNEMLGTMHNFIMMQEKGVDLNYHPFAHVSSLLSFFDSAANWFCPFSFDHPSLYDISAATRFLGMVAHNKSCDTDRYCMVLSMAPHLPEIQIIKKDAVTLEETKVEADEVDDFVEKISEEISLSDDSASQSLLSIDPDILRRHAVCCVQDCFRFFTLYKGIDDNDNPFSQPLRLWEEEEFQTIFGSDATIRELADWLFDIDSYADAISLYLRLPFDADIHQRLGYAYEETNNFELAERHYREALLLDADDEWLQQRMINLCRRTGNLSTAEYLLRGQLEKSPDDFNRLHNLAEILLLQEEWKEAKTLLLKLDYLRPNHLPTMRALAWCQLSLGSYAVAADIYNRIIMGDALLPDDYINAGHCALLQNDIPLATAYYQEALRLRNAEFAPADFLKEDERFLQERGVDLLTQHQIIDLLNI